MRQGMRGQSQTQILLIVIIVLLAVVIGLLIGRQFAAPAAPAAGAAVQAVGGAVDAQGNPIHNVAAAPDLTPAELAVIEGFTCNCQEPGCNFLPLTTCTCDTARAMHKVVRQLVAQGQGSAEVGAHLEELWGDGIYPGSATSSAP